MTIRQLLLTVLIVSGLLPALPGLGGLCAQPTAPAAGPQLAVDSRKGYSARIPPEARLDSARSGWSPKGLYERRVYVIAGAGEIRFTVTVRAQTIPDSATKGRAYTYLDADSATSAGTSYTRTYYLPTRSVRIQIIPYGQSMKRYIDARAVIFNSFRWKPKAATDVILVD